MLYLVTGADGFLGRHVLAELARRDSPAVAMLHPDVPAVELPGSPRQVRADLRDEAALAAAVEGVTHVIHLAARVHMMHDTAADPEKAFREVNVTGTGNVLAAAAAAGARRFLLMSSVKAMGEEEVGVFDETTEPHPASPYGRSKLAAERLLFERAGELGLHAVVLRLPMVYGPGNKGNMLRLLDAASRGKRLPLGAVRNRRSMVYVGNVVDAVLAAIDANAGSGEAFLVCDERPYNTRELYETLSRQVAGEPLLRNVPVPVLKAMGLVGSALQRLTGKEMPVDRGVIRRLTGDLCFDSSKIERVLGFHPRVGLDEGIAATVDWYQQGCPPTPPA
ncbi:MAG: NAD-dependent epimerase/dehydratase family protein [Planctomycetota bacterium]